MSADHGICPLPEVSRATHPGARRVDPTTILKAAEAFLDRTYGAPTGKTRWFQPPDPAAWFYFNQALLRARGLKQAEVEETLAGWLRQQPDVEAAYTRTQLLAGVSEDDPIGRRVRKSFHPDRAGDVVAVLEPYRLALPTLSSGTTHGTPHPYDTHVPLVVFGPGVKRGVRQDEVTPQAAAAILAHALGVKAPAKAEAPLPEDLFVQ
jgi:hypothetical protein